MIFLSKFLAFISVYFARLFARLLHKGKPRKLTEIRFSYIANKS